MKILISRTKIKIILSALVFGIVGLFSLERAFAAEKVNVYLFWGEGCPHCEKEKEFLANLMEEGNDIALKDFEVYKNLEGRKRLIKAAERLDVEVSGVPFLVIGDNYIVGYLSDDTTGKEIIKLIEENRKNGYLDIFEDWDEVSEDANRPALPKIANLDLEKLSLPALTVVLGFLDGFNPCAMWVLLFLISLLIGMENKKKMWALGIAFIVASAFVYFLFMVAWLNLFQFVGFIFWVRAAIAIIALIGGYSSLRKFFSKDPAGCDVGDPEKKKKIFEKLGNITSNKSFLLAMFGIIGLAFAVNLVELVCSAGLPAVYTQVLSMNNLNGTSYYLYILLYILFFMLDDLFVFFVAMTTLKMTGITTKYVKYTRLIGGILMLIIGVLLLFKPELLMIS